MIAAFCLLWSGTALAACASPFGNEGDVLYNAEIANLTYCDGTNWNRINDSYGVPIGGLVGHWTFGDGSGTTATDVSGNGNDGTFVNSPTWTSGRLGGALLFNKDNRDAVQVAGLMGMPQNVTLSAWVNVTALDSGFSGIVSVTDIGNYINLEITDTEIWGNFFDGSTFWRTQAGAILLDDGWRHVAYTFDDINDEQRVYLDGSSIATTNYTTSIDWTTRGSNTFIGRHAYGWGDADFDGLIDDVRIYERVLSASEVQTLYEMGNGEPEDPVAYWKFDDGSGTTATDSAGTSDGTLQNGPVWTGGRFAGALDFDGTDDYARIPHSDAIAGFSALTLSAWVNPSGPPSASWEHIVSKDNGTNADYGLIWVGSSAGECAIGDIQFRLAAGSGGSSCSTAPISENTGWHHIAGTWDGTTMGVYIDGQLSDTSSFSGTLTDAMNDLGIGSNVDDPAGRSFDGLIDDVRIYDRALTTAEVEHLYQGACDNPVGWSGDLFYDANSDVVRWCGGGIWHAAGMVPGAGGSGCSDPSGVRGDIFYNVDYMVPVYCDGTYWRRMAGKPDIPTDGLIAYWSFDTGSGTTAKDWSGNGNDGTLTNMDPSSDWVTGKVGSHALDFDGVDDYVSLSGGVSLPADFALSFWVKWEGDDRSAILGTGNAYVVEFNSSSLRFRPCNSDRDSFGKGAINLGEWYHFAVVGNTAGDLTAYKNGNPLGTGSNGDRCDITMIGERSGATFYHQGGIDEIRLYHRSLTAGEVKALYLNGL